jgi:N-acetyl-gamma-glutamyl-phosphate reductase
VGAVPPNLTHHTDLFFSDDPLEKVAEACEAVFLALPHGEAMTRVEEFAKRDRLILDLSADFRLKDPKAWEAAYGRPHAAPELLPSFVYGQTECFREEILKSRRIACPGCFPTGSILALAPLAREGLLKGRVVVSAATGSSGSGAEPGDKTHHPTRAEDFRAYKPFVHPHVHEIVQALAALGARDLELLFIPHSAPMVRGIFTTAVATLAVPMDTSDIQALYRLHYQERPFVRVLPESPRAGVVAGTNFADLSATALGRNAVLLSAVDNLVKGAAGQAVQNLNLVMGWPETTGLEFPGNWP